MKLLPVLNEKFQINDGAFVKSLSFCLNNSDKDKCLKFYKDIKQKDEEGIYKCPYGLCIYYKKNGSRNEIYTSLRIQNLFKKANEKFRNESVYNPILSTEQIYTLLNFNVRNTLDKEMDEESFNSMTHEVSKLNGQLKEHCELLFNNYGDKTDLFSLGEDEYHKLLDSVKTLYVISSMINSRYAVYNYERSKDSLSVGNKINTNIYKKFDKCRIVLKNYKKKNVHLNFTGQSYYYIKAYALFEMVPFLLLENAIKYSLDDSEVDVEFYASSNTLKVKITSFSPYCSTQDIDSLTIKNYRGKNARKISDGNGIGLYFVKILCDMHNIDIDFKSDSDEIKNIENVAYAPFCVTLDFHDIFELDYFE